MSRTIYAEIIAYEDQIIRNCETNGIPDDGTISILEHEFGWLEQSGFALSQAILSDSDDPEDWARYINYVMTWAFQHMVDPTTQPILPYTEWLNCDSRLYDSPDKESLENVIKELHSERGLNFSQNEWAFLKKAGYNKLDIVRLCGEKYRIYD